MSNEKFGVPADVEARLRAQAEAEVAASVDEAALLAQFKEEARAAIEAKLRVQATDSEATKQLPMDAHGFPKKYFKINVYKGQGKHDLQRVPVGVNGYVWQLERGVDVIVPSVVVDGLNEAITEVTIESHGGLVTRPAHRFPYQLLGEATEAEYKAFVEANREQAKAA